MNAQRYTCPCCGHRTLCDSPGSFVCCEVCYWEDDPIQLLDPAYTGGANRPSLIECQSNFERFGASELWVLDLVRPPTADEPRDPEWRPARASDLDGARLPRDLSDEERSQAVAWYHWLR